MRIIVCAICLITVLTACGGGGSGSGPALSLDGIRDLTGLSAPVETPAAQRARSPNILSRTDSLIISTMYGETSHPDIPTFRLRAQCSGTRCTMSEPRTGSSYTIRLSDFEIVHGPTDAIGTRHGITLMSLNTQQMGSELSSFGAWMDHSAFAVQTERTTLEGTRIDARYGMAGGDLTGSPVGGSATWLGIMVGTPTTGSDRGDRLQGIAALNYDMSAGGGLDIAFSNIKNIDRGTAHTAPTVLFADVLWIREACSRPAWPATASGADFTVPVTPRQPASSSSPTSSGPLGQSGERPRRAARLEGTRKWWWMPSCLNRGMGGHRDGNRRT